MVDIGKTRDLLVKKPFTRVTPLFHETTRTFTRGDDQEYPSDDLTFNIVTQSDFLREFHPSGHKINSQLYYPDIYKTNPDTGEIFVEVVDRCCFAFQKVITVKQLVHLCGNSVQFEDMTRKSTNDTDETFFDFVSGWAKKDMEVAWYEAAKSVKVTGDTAIVGYKKNGVFGCKVLSFLNGDTLFPKIDPLTGDTTVFARLFHDYDEEGNTVTDWLEVWDDKYKYTLKRDKTGISNVINFFKKIFKLEGFSLVSYSPHGFNYCPVAYHRDDDGPCWTFSQNSIEGYEKAFSMMSQNNEAYAFPIMYFKGDDVEIKGDVMRGTISNVSMGKDDDVGFLNRQDVSEAFFKQLDKLYKMIFEQSFTVIPPELKSGDLPGVAIKLLYSPAYEKAISDAQEFKPFINKVVQIFKDGYGAEIAKSSKFNTLNVSAWIKPYIHQNWTETITNLATAVQNGFMSRQRASEVADEYTTPAEWDRILEEKKREQQDEILKTVELEKAKSTTNNVTR